MKTIIYTFFAVMLLCGAACDGCPEKLPTVYMSDEMKQYIVQPVGSYWIYQDSATGVIDSLYLKEQSIGVKGMAEEDCRDYEVIENTFTSSYRKQNDGRNVFFAGGQDGSYYGGYYGHYIDTIKKPDGTYYIAYYDSIQIGKLYYKQVKSFTDFYGFQVTYMAKNIGMVRYERGKGRWNLIRYHINK